MLSKTSSRILRLMSKWASFLGGMPCEWDDRMSKLRISEKGWAKWTFWVAHLAINFFIYSAKLLFALLSSSKSSKREYIHDRLLGYQTLILYAMFMLLSINTWYHVREIVCFVNSFIRYSQHFRGAYVKRRRRGWRNGCETILRLLTFFTICLPVLNSLVYCSDPNNIRYMTSLLPQTTPSLIYIPLYIGYGVLYTFWGFSIISTANFYIMLTILPTFVSFQILHEIRGDRHFYISRPMLRRPPRLCQVYRSLQLLTRLFNNAFTFGMYPMAVAAQLLSVLGNTLLIKFYKMETPLFRLLLLLGPNIYLSTWLLSLHLYGLLWRKSTITVASWQHLRLKVYGDSKLLNVFKSSAEPLKIRIGNIYFVKPARVVVTVHSVLRSSLKLLLAIKKKMK